MFEIFKREFITIPFASRNVMYYTNEGSRRGYTECFIFGIRIMKIQRTKPWE